jgi:predicted nucleic acid-binding protein
VADVRPATLIDTSVLLDLLTDDEEWADWSIAHLDAAAVAGPICINPVIYAELAVRFDSVEALDTALRQAGVTIAPLPRPALFLAAQVFRKHGRSGVTPECFIGAHAAVERMPLLTRDPDRYRGAFPTVSLIAPEDEDWSRASA